MVSLTTGTRRGLRRARGPTVQNDGSARRVGLLFDRVVQRIEPFEGRNEFAGALAVGLRHLVSIADNGVIDIHDGKAGAAGRGRGRHDLGRAIEVVVHRAVYNGIEDEACRERESGEHKTGFVEDVSHSTYIKAFGAWYKGRCPTSDGPCPDYNS